MNTLKTSLLMALLFGLFMAVGRLLGGTSGMAAGFVMALGTNFLAYWFSDRMALAMSGAQEVDEAQAPELYDSVRRLARRAGLPMPRVYLIPDEQPNAFATGRSPRHSAVAATVGLVRLLPPNELDGVIAHELAHIKNRDILVSSIAATMGGAISMVAQITSFQSLFGGQGGDGEEESGGPGLLGTLLGIIVAPIAAFLIQMAVSRTREYGADRGGAEISGDPLALASALRRIERCAEQAPMVVSPAASHLYIINPLGGDGLRSLAALFRTHPLTEERIARLEAMATAAGSGGASPAARETIGASL